MDAGYQLCAVWCAQCDFSNSMLTSSHCPDHTHHSEGRDHGQAVHSLTTYYFNFVSHNTFADTKSHMFKVL